MSTVEAGWLSVVLTLSYGSVPRLLGTWMTNDQAPVPSSQTERGQIVPLWSSVRHLCHGPREGETHHHIPCIPST